MGDFHVNAAGESVPSSDTRPAVGRRRVRLLAATLSAVMLVIVVVMSIRGRHHLDTVAAFADRVGIGSHGGRTLVVLAGRPVSDDAAWWTELGYSRRWFDMGLVDDFVQCESDGNAPAWRKLVNCDWSSRTFLGFHTERGTPRSWGRSEWDVYLPNWFLAAALVVLPWRAIRQWRTARRDRLDGRCRRCGYDLRATPDRCPECGEPAIAMRTADAISTSS